MTEPSHRCPYCRTELRLDRRWQTLEAGADDDARTESADDWWVCPKGHDWERGPDGL